MPPPGEGAVSLEGREVVEIRERMFATQVSDIYTNVNNYLSKAIRYEGFYEEIPFDEDQIFRCVVRWTGCCADDYERVGFEVIWDQPYPRINDWVEVAGVLEQYDEDGQTRVRLRLVSLKVLDERGADLVAQ